MGKRAVVPAIRILPGRHEPVENPSISRDRPSQIQLGAVRVKPAGLHLERTNGKRYGALDHLVDHAAHGAVRHEDGGWPLDDLKPLDDRHVRIRIGLTAETIDEIANVGRAVEAAQSEAIVSEIDV